MRAAFFTLGCKVNQYETSALQRQFSDEGFTIVSWDMPAEVYVVNSCTVTATGDKKSRQMLRHARRQNPDAVVALCGCFPQAFPHEAAQIPEADIVVGSKNRSALLQAVLDQLNGKRQKLVDISPHERGEIFEPLVTDSFSARTRAFVKIQDGCERYCAYCIIPKARGPIRSKPLADLEEELAGLTRAGYREVVLVGINLSCYGADLGYRLLDAVTLACKTPGVSRVRLGSLEPELLTEEDMAALSQLDGLCPQFHLSLQSGCDETLRRMRRHYDTAEYRRIADGLRRFFPGCAITTDVMVGFPGETDEEFLSSMAFVEEIGFARTHVFAYSKRDGTAAAAMPGQISPETKALRARKMAEITEECAGRFRRSMLGKTVRVLFETMLSPGVWEGYSENYTPVKTFSQEDLSGQILAVTLTGADDRHCVGDIITQIRETSG